MIKKYNVLSMIDKVLNYMKSFTIRYKMYLVGVLAGLLVVWGFESYQMAHHPYIIAKFKQYKPAQKKVDIFYNGIKVGRAGKVTYSDDYRYTMVKLVLLRPKVKFPKNITAQLKTDKKLNMESSFIELVYPDSPQVTNLKMGDTIQGAATMDLADFMANQDPGVLESMKNNTNKTMEAAQKTMDSLTELSDTLNKTINENRPNLLTTTKNLAGVSTNLNQITSKLNKALTQENLSSIVTNADGTLVNIQDLTKQVQNVTDNINNQTMPAVDSTVAQLEGIVKNLNEITCGINHTLRKSFGGMRLMFGKTITDDCNSTGAAAENKKE